MGISGTPNAVTLGRDRRVQVGQRFLIIEPGTFGHEAFNELQDTVGPIDKATASTSRASAPTSASRPRRGGARPWRLRSSGRRQIKESQK